MYLGAATLGKVGGEMMITDPFVLRMLHPSQTMFYAGKRWPWPASWWQDEY